MARNATAAATKTADETRVRYHVMDAPNGLNLRKGPHVSFERLAVLDNGSEVEVLSLPGGIKVPYWSLVATPDHTGWVMDRFLKDGRSGPTGAEPDSQEA